MNLEQIDKLIAKARLINYEIYSLDQEFSAIILELGHAIHNDIKLRSQLKTNGWTDESLDTFVRATSNSPKDYDYEKIVEAINNITLPVEL